MCILCVVQKWSRRVATMLPWLVIPLIGLWAFSQLFPPGFRFEVTSPRLACVLVLLVTLFWYEILMPQLSSWRARRSARLIERKRFEAIEMQKLRKMATRRCRNCLTPYREQNPGSGRFMCSYCGHISKRPVLDIPGSAGLGISNSGIIGDLVGKGGKIWNGKAWSENGWISGHDWLENGSFSTGNFTGKSNFWGKNGRGFFSGDDRCLAEKSYSGVVVFVWRLLTSLFLSIRWLWRKIFRVTSKDGASSDAEKKGMLSKKGENGVDFHGSIYTAMKVPKVVDLHSLQHLPDMFKDCGMPDLQRLRDDFKTSLPSMDMLQSLSAWNILEPLTNCLPERFSHVNHTDICVLQSMKDDVANMIAPLMLRPITRWPFFAFLGGAMFCLFASSTCHLLSCHSERLSYIMLRVDYAGIAALISTSFYPLVYYSFMCNPFFCNLYLGFITVLGIATVMVSLIPAFQNPEFRNIRTFLFFGMGMSGVAPILHKLILFGNQPEAVHTTGYEILMGVFYGLGALVYATRIPERWKPGKFDIAGHSHQLFHVLVVAGAYTHYRAGLVYLKWRDMQGC